MIEKKIIIIHLNQNLQKQNNYYNSILLINIYIQITILVTTNNILYLPDFIAYIVTISLYYNERSLSLLHTQHTNTQ